MLVCRLPEYMLKQGLFGPRVLKTVYEDNAKEN